MGVAEGLASLAEEGKTLARELSNKAGNYKRLVERKKHMSFIANNTDHAYVEGHHLIPKKWQGSFSNEMAERLIQDDEVSLFSGINDGVRRY